MKRLIPLLFSFSSLLLFLACSPPPPELPPQDIITQAADRMKAAPGFHFVIDRQGAPAFLDPDQTLSFRRAEGDYVAPDRAKASVRVIAPGIVAEIQAVAIGERYWETNFLTGEWQELPAELAFNPAILFDPETGLQPILLADLTNLTLNGVVELDDLPGLSLYHLTGTLDTTHLYDLSYTLIGPAPVQTEIWIAPDTFDLYRILLTEPAPAAGGEPTIWQVDFWNIGEVVEISPPS
ncbi:MAG TPA: LppX_LprAFG lipoprotein [Anaerolineales bacterium]|nr:LppX_LprAFG lipoprotein [Anaerolineales bacterium]